MLTMISCILGVSFLFFPPFVVPLDRFIEIIKKPALWAGFATGSPVTFSTRGEVFATISGHRFIAAH